MARILIVVASQDGQTRRIADRLADRLRPDGHEVRLEDAAPFPSVAGADGIIIAASVHMGRHPGALARAVRAHATVLRHLPTAFLSVCLSAACIRPEHRAEADRYLRDFVERTGWQPDLATSVAGALSFSRYGPLRAYLARALARRKGLTIERHADREYTDWDDVRRFAEAFSALLAATPARRLAVRSPVHRSP